MFCEKPVGGTPEQVARAARAARTAGVISGVGYNYRWAPLVRYARELIASGELGEITNYRGRFFSMYGADPLGVNSWRFQLDQAGYGVTSDLMSHAVDLAHMLLGPITRLTGTVETFIRERPSPGDGASHYGRGRPEDPRTPVTNEDYAAMLCTFASGARGTFEVSRTLIGPESENAFDVYGTRGAVGWNFERLNELRLYRATEDRGSGYTHGARRRPLRAPRRRSCPAAATRSGSRTSSRSRTTSSAPRWPRSGRSSRASSRRSHGRPCRPRCCARTRAVAGSRSSR